MPSLFHDVYMIHHILFSRYYSNAFLRILLISLTELELLALLKDFNEFLLLSFQLLRSLLLLALIILDHCLLLSSIHNTANFSARLHFSVACCFHQLFPAALQRTQHLGKISQSCSPFQCCSSWKNLLDYYQSTIS